MFSKYFTLEQSFLEIVVYPHISAENALNFSIVLTSEEPWFDIGSIMFLAERLQHLLKQRRMCFDF